MLNSVRGWSETVQKVASRLTAEVIALVPSVPKFLRKRSVCPEFPNGADTNEAAQRKNFGIADNDSAG